MATMKNWENVLDYVVLLGFSGSRESSIQARQDSLMCAVDAIERAAGIPQGTKGDAGYPFQITFKRYRSPAGHVFPWLSRFEIKRLDGTRQTLEMASVSFDQYLRNRGLR